MTCSQCLYQFCWYCKREWVSCCNENIASCVGLGILKHRIWGQQPTVRYTTKVIGLPIVASVMIGVGATGLGIGACGAKIGLVGLPFYLTGKYVVKKIVERRLDQNVERFY